VDGLAALVLSGFGAAEPTGARTVEFVAVVLAVGGEEPQQGGSVAPAELDAAAPTGVRTGELALAEAELAEELLAAVAAAERSAVQRLDCWDAAVHRQDLAPAGPAHC
jgi:hypothetical protein